jgi:hypothetical protein
MFIRLRQTNATRSRVVINSDFIVSIEAQEAGSVVNLSNSAIYEVEESERAIRGLLDGGKAAAE